jgi:hypothetical protein
MPQRAFRSALNHRPIRHRIAEGHTQLEDARPSPGQFDDQTMRGFKVGVAGRDKGNEAFAAFAFECLECLSDS